MPLSTYFSRRAHKLDTYVTQYSTSYRIELTTNHENHLYRGHQEIPYKDFGDKPPLQRIRIQVDARNYYGLDTPICANTRNEMMFRCTKTLQTHTWAATAKYRVK